jgi:hypothetical protein
MFKWLKQWNYMREEYTEAFLGEEVKRVSEDVRLDSTAESHKRSVLPFSGFTGEH